MATPVRVAIAGYGTIGRDVASRLAHGAVADARLTAVSARDLERARIIAAMLPDPPAAVPLGEIVDHADVVIESASAAAFGEIAQAVLRAGKTLIPVSVSALPRHPDLGVLARRHGGRIVVPSGGAIGLDAVKAAAEDGISRALVRMRLRPESVANETYVRKSGLDLGQAEAGPLLVFRGSVREAAVALPNHCNNPVALALAGAGIDATQVEVFVQTDLPGAKVEIEVDAEAVTLRLVSQNLPSAASPRTSRIIAASVVAALRSMLAPIATGT